MIAFVWLLNFAISWLNAWGCGRSWNESKHSGGFPHLLNWSAAIMSASGFTWCYLVIAVFVGGSYNVEQEDGSTGPLLAPDQIQAMADLGYLLVYFPIVGSGMVILVNSWARFYRKRSLATAAETGYNTWAQMYNIYTGLENVPSAFGGVTDFFFGGSKSSSSSSDRGKGVVLLLVVFAALAGILTTYTIVTRTAARVARDRVFEGRLREL